MLLHKVALLAIALVCIYSSSSCSPSFFVSSARSTSPHSIFSNRPHQYASKFLKAIEPLQTFSITHSDEAIPLAGFHPDAPSLPKPESKRTAQVKKQSKHALFEEENATEDDHDYHPDDLNHWTVSGPPHSYHEGQPQLFPDKIQLQLTAFDEKIILELHIIRDLFNQHSVTTAMAGDEVVSTHRHVLQSYWTTLHNGWASATLHRDGKFQAIIHRDGETIQVDPVEIHQQDMHPQRFKKLSKASRHPSIGHVNTQKGMVVHRHSDFVDLSDSHKCGAVNVADAAHHAQGNASTIIEEPLGPYRGSSRRLFQTSTSTASSGYGSFPGVANAAGVTAWSNCYFGDSKPQRISVGFAVDTGMYEVWGSVAGVQQYIAWQVSVINLIYLTQLNMFLTISDIIVETAISEKANPWNDKPPSAGAKCKTTIAEKLNLLSSWRGSKQTTQNSIWSLQTNCYPPSGTVGLAWINVLCNTYYGTSISTYTSNQWLTTAHEIGHNFGASHTFQLGQGSTGGIMDYGDGKLNGYYQFNTEYSKTEVCSGMGNTLYARTFAPYCVSSYTPVCGNGILEPGETCDDKSTCCGQPGSQTPCQLTSTSQCSGETPCCTGCKFKPSSTVCLNGNGYCQNGFCAASACTGYNGLSFCGTVSANPCRQQCLSSTTKQCSSGYTSPNLNVPDGIVCNASPYSVCQGGVCVESGTAAAPVVTYAWTTSTWSTCSCEGTQNRAVYCMGSDGSIGTQCPTASQPSASQSCTPPASCVTYSWKISPWSTCSVDCGGGIASATVQCVSSSTGLAVSDSSCTTSKPASTQSCSTQACVTGFVYSTWSPCSAGCGGGVSTRTATCQQTQNGVIKTVANSYCTDLQATSQACNTDPCTSEGSALTYKLTYGAWGACSASCGTGTQSRSPFCLGSDGKTYDLSNCGCGPNTSNYWCAETAQACNTNLCPSYAWVAPEWSTCTVLCGGGIQTRAVQCMNTVENAAVANTFCTAAQPAGVQSCNTQACSTYKWSPGIWESCSRSCGGGAQQRSVTCTNEQGTVVSNGLCTDPKPATSQICNVQACPKFQWIVSDWSTCSAWCDGGTQTRSVKCVASGSLSTVSYSNCDTTNIPLTAQYCNTDVKCPLNSDTQWVLSAWSNCSQICGGDGIRNRTVICTNSTTGAEVDPKFCPVDYIPEIAATCDNIVCPTYWFTSPWSSCTAQCSGGTQTRSVECRYVNGDLKIDDALCTGTKPSLTGDCNLYPCPKWVASDWGECSTRCNDGIQTREVSCITWDYQNTTSDACAGLSAPATSQVCRNQPCPHWQGSPWSYCNQPCGGGNRTRSLVCRMPHDDMWKGQIVDDDTLCPQIAGGDAGDGVGEASSESVKPPSWETCNTLPCPAYYWDTDKWSMCSASCGGGTQEGAVVCRSSADDSIVDGKLCLDTPPSNTRECNVDPCPVYQWVATEPWTNCSVVCGSGTQTRVVHCADTNPAKWKNVSYDITKDVSLCSSQPKPPTIQPCSFPKSVCFGNDGSTTKEPNGLCTDEGTCLCRAGWAGTYCERTPKITDVLTNGGSYAQAGVPFGDILQIKWQSEGSIPYVSVLLLRNHASNAAERWPFPTYIAKDIINTGSYSWTVGEFMKDLESGDGFSIRIWFSEQVWAENATPFTIADPCAYKSCGLHGTCGVGGVCQCIPGYSGDTCALGPCERAMCSTSYGSCNNDNYIGRPNVTSETVGVCLCGQNANGYFDGYQCRTPPGCTPKCKNGADLFNVIIDLDGKTSEEKGQCGVCGCTNMWQGDDCGTCGLKCHNGGVANEKCSSCDCSNVKGYFGPTCSCKYYLMQLRLTLDDSSFVNDPIASARFARTLATDLALASGQTTGINVQVNVVKLTLDPSQANSVIADIQFGLECPMLSEAIINGGSTAIDTETAKALRGISTRASATEGQAFNNLLSPRTVKNARYSAFYPTKAAQIVRAATSSGTGSASGSTGPSTGTIPSSIEIKDGRPTLLSVYNVVVGMFEDLSSPVYRGVITSSVNHASVVSVSDPSNEDQPRLPNEAVDPFKTQQSQLDDDNSSSSGLGIGVIVGIAVGSFVGVCLCLLLSWYIFSLSRHKTVYTNPPLASKEAQAEAESNATEMAASQTATPAESPASTPHHTPPQQRRKLDDAKYHATPVIAEEKESDPELTLDQPNGEASLHQVSLV